MLDAKISALELGDKAGLLVGWLSQRAGPISTAVDRDRPRRAHRHQ